MIGFTLLMLGIGMIMSMVGYVWLIIVAFEMGVLYVVGLFVVPCFPFFMLMVDMERTWKPLALNFAGGLVSMLGYVPLLASIDSRVADAEYGGFPMDDPTPVMPGSYVAPAEPLAADGPGFLASVDPMLFALAGGAIIFCIVAIVVAGFFLMTDRSAPDDTKVPPTL